MGLFDSIKKFINAAEDISKAVEKNQNKKPSEIVSTTTVKPAPPKANTKTSPADILSSGNIPAKASTQRKEEFFGGETAHKAEKILMNDWVICPLYYYADGFLASDRIENFYVTNSGVAYFVNAKV